MLGWRKTERPTPVQCSYCRKLLAARLAHRLEPSPRVLTTLGAVPMKSIGWFCSRRCVDAYESRFRVILEPEAWGEVEARLGCELAG
ncbi:MAG TPA: hypothetical protein VK454_00680 [Myxococcaceae bacterium]|nr:hypothetical protein [Myxococcaceae bacterium]